MATTAQLAKAKKYNIEKSKGKIKFETRAFNRCAVSGRARGYIRYFGLSRIAFRQLALDGKIPGVKKSSW